MKMASPTKAAATVERAASFRGPMLGGGGDSARVLRRFRHLGRAGAAVGRRDRARRRGTGRFPQDDPASRRWDRLGDPRPGRQPSRGRRRDRGPGRHPGSRGLQCVPGRNWSRMLARSGRLAAEETGAATPTFRRRSGRGGGCGPGCAGPDGRRARQSCRPNQGASRSGRHARRQDRAGPGGPGQLRGLAHEHRPAARADRRGDRHGRRPSAQGVGAQAADARPAARPSRPRGPAQRGCQQRRAARAS